VGIGYGDSITEAQEVARKVLADHPAVLADPEPLVLVESLGKSSVQLRIYYWLDAREHSLFKIRSSVIRMVKTALDKHGISIPDEAREVVFPRGVPVIMSEARGEPTGEVDAGADKDRRRAPRAERAVATEAEAGLSSEAEDIEKQSRKVQPLSEGENLLKGAAGDRSDLPP